MIQLSNKPSCDWIIWVVPTVVGRKSSDFGRRSFLYQRAVSLDPLSPEKEPNIDVNTPNGAGDNAIALAERHCGLESMISCRDSRLF